MLKIAAFICWPPNNFPNEIVLMQLKLLPKLFSSQTMIVCAYKSAPSDHLSGLGHGNFNIVRCCLNTFGGVSGLMVK